MTVSKINPNTCTRKLHTFQKIYENESRQVVFFFFVVLNKLFLVELLCSF